MAQNSRGYWVGGTQNIVTNNVASCCNIGFDVFTMGGGNPGSVRQPAFKGADPMLDGVVVNIQTQPLLEWDGNEAGCRMETGLGLWRVCSPNGEPWPEAPRSVIGGMKIWHCHHSAHYGYQHSNVTFDGLVVRGDRAGMKARRRRGKSMFNRE